MSRGKQLYVADFNAIEPRVLFWLANDQAALDVFRSGKCIYMDFAASIYGYPVTDKKKQDTERQFGKVGILALGYGQGKAKFPETAYALSGGTVVIQETAPCKVCGGPEHARQPFVMEKGGLRRTGPDIPVHDFEPDEAAITSEKVVDSYRTKYWRVKDMWFEVERAAIKAVKRPRNPVKVGKVTWEADDDFLYCTLPSGRRLGYPSPAIQMRATPWGQERPSLTYKGISQFNCKWMRQHVYGGLLVENITQAVARDLLASAMLRCEKSGIYAPILSVHDEILAEADEGAGNVAEFEHLMATIPRWAQGLPVVAEGWRGKRYRK